MTNPIKGTEIAERMLLMQYQESPNFKQYMAAFVEEMDFLFQQIEEVYLGRFIDVAEGRQLDIIGIILNEFRNVDLPTQFFGFSDNGSAPVNVAPLADEASPSDGGVFRSEGQLGTSNFELSDGEYRRLLLAKAYLSTKYECSINNTYYAIATLLGRYPQQMHITTTSPRQVLLTLSQSDVSLSDTSLITYFLKYLVPLGTSFTITRV